jgi:hypothetical protein
VSRAAAVDRTNPPPPAPHLQLRRSGLPTARTYVVVVPSHAHRFVYSSTHPHHLLLLRSQSVEDGTLSETSPMLVDTAGADRGSRSAPSWPLDARLIERRWRSGRDRGRPVRRAREGRRRRGGTGGGGGGGGDGTTTATTAIAAAATTTTTTGRAGGVRNLGKTVQLAARYRAIEIAFLNITSSSAPTSSTTCPCSRSSRSRPSPSSCRSRSRGGGIRSLHRPG